LPIEINFEVPDTALQDYQLNKSSSLGSLPIYDDDDDYNQDDEEWENDRKLNPNGQISKLKDRLNRM
jgi:hypothetical protein